MTIQTKLENIKNALLKISNNVYHYHAPESAGIPYIVWYEEGEAGSIEADGHKIEQAISGWVEFYTYAEFDSTVDKIQEALNSISNLGWSYRNIVKGDPIADDQTVHHSWEWTYG